MAAISSPTNTHCSGAVAQLCEFLNYDAKSVNKSTIKFLSNTYRIISNLNKTQKTLPSWPSAKKKKKLYEAPIVTTSVLEIYSILMVAYYVAFIFGFSGKIGYMSCFWWIALRDYKKLLSEPKEIILTDRNTLRGVLKVNGQKSMDTIEKILYVFYKGISDGSGRWAVFNIKQLMVIGGLLYSERLMESAKYASNSSIKYGFNCYNRTARKLIDVIHTNDSKKIKVEKSGNVENSGSLDNDDDDSSDMEIVSEDKKHEGIDEINEIPDCSLSLIINKYNDEGLIAAVMDEMDKRHCMFSKTDDSYNIIIFESTLMNMDWQK